MTQRMLKRDRKKSQKKKRAYLKGLLFEHIATLYLILKGYTVLRRRYKTPVGEVDLLVCDRKTLVVVEIKHRKNHSDVFHALTPLQKRRIQRSAQWASKHFPQFLHVRIDTVLISSFKWPIHIQNAFS